MNKKLTIGAIVVAVVIVLAVVFVQQSRPQEVKIGFLGGFTGPIESLAPPIFSGAELAVAQVNAQGGILDGETLLIPSADTSCADASVAVSGADRLVNTEGVTAIVGALCSGATIAAANQVAVPANVVMISPASTSPALTTLADNDLVYRTPPSDAYQGEVLAQLLISKGIEDAAVTYVNNDYGKGLADAFAAAFEARGGDVTANLAHEDGKADYRAEIGSLTGSGSENLVVLAYADGSGQTILRQAYESGAFSTYIGADGMVGDALVAAVGADVLAGMIATRPGTPELPGADLFAAQAEEAGFDPNAVFAGQAYDAAFMLALAIEKNGSNSRDGLSAALRDIASAPGEVILPGEWEKAKRLIAAGTDINYEGATGSHEFDANGDVPGVIVEMTVRGGRFVEVGRAGN
ncbi:ABC transporter substrate-binding protein [Saccharospirillum mangrovi]|uniref:ABC transporter substrate-binding protein n=1 Tax=Saccharospirillum mangrovi TaxID=2161747 RepID=UPI000D356CF1|nr:ABC transporter substrate-binding protein [Saccharospirillum mangrovi]